MTKGEPRSIRGSTMLKPLTYLVEVGLYNSRQAIYNARYRNNLEITLIKVGNRLLVDEDDVKAFVESRKVTPSTDNSGR